MKKKVGIGISKCLKLAMKNCCDNQMPPTVLGRGVAMLFWTLSVPTRGSAVYSWLPAAGDRDLLAALLPPPQLWVYSQNPGGPAL
jgi:hypothetical protein